MHAQILSVSESACHLWHKTLADFLARTHEHTCARVDLCACACVRGSVCARHVFLCMLMYACVCVCVHMCVRVSLHKRILEHVGTSGLVHLQLVCIRAHIAHTAQMHALKKSNRDQLIRYHKQCSNPAHVVQYAQRMRLLICTVATAGWSNTQ